MRKLSYSFKSIGISLLLVGKRSYRKKKNYSHPHLFIYVKHYALSTRLTLFLSEIRQKCESQNGCFRKTKHAKFSETQTFLTPWYQRIRNVRFSENLASFAFLKHPFWGSPFCLIADVLSFLTKTEKNWKKTEAFLTRKKGTNTYWNLVLINVSINQLTKPGFSAYYEAQIKTKFFFSRKENKWNLINNISHFFKR